MDSFICCETNVVLQEKKARSSFTKDGVTFVTAMSLLMTTTIEVLAMSAAHMLIRKNALTRSHLFTLEDTTLFVRLSVFVVTRSNWLALHSTSDT